MTAHRDHRQQDAQEKHVPTESKAIKPHEVAEVYKTLGLDNEEARRRYLDWYNAGQSDPETGFEIVEQGDTLTFE